MALLLGAAAPCRAAGDPDFELRKFAEVSYNNGDTEMGVVTETDDSNVCTIKNYKTQITHSFNKSDVKEIRPQRTADTAIEEFSKDWDSTKNAPKLLKRLHYAWKTWGVQDKVIVLLEKASASNNPDVLDYLSELYMSKGRSKDALRVADTLVSTAPSRARSYLWRGKAELAENKMGPAETDLKKAYEMANTDEDIIVAYSQFLTQAGRSKEAAKLLQGVLDKAPGNTAAVLTQGMLLLRQGDLEEAERAFNQAPLDDLQAKIGLASVKLMRKQYDDAYRLAEQVLSRNNRSGEAFEIEAMAKLLSGDKDSLDKFDDKIAQAFKEKPDQPRLLLAWAVGLEREAKYIELAGGKTAADDARAKRELSQAKYKDLFAANPNDAVLKYFIGEWNFRKGDFAAAEASFNAVADMSPRYAPGLAAAGATALRLRKWEDAKKFYEAAGALEPANAEYQAGQGLALLGEKELGAAKPKLERALALDNKNVSALCGLGYIENAAREKDSAIKFFEQALSANGKCSWAADGLKKIYAQSGMEMQYLTFDDNVLPAGWGGKQRGIIKPVVEEGHVHFFGTQGSSNGDPVEFCTDARADDFVRIEADFDAVPGNTATFGIRLAGGQGSRFFLEFAKTETDELKVRKADATGASENWTNLGIKWPDNGHGRFAIEADDLKSGVCAISFNGKKYAEVQVKLNRTNKVTTGVFVQIPANTSINIAADNIALLLRQPASAADADAGPGGGIKVLTNPDEEKKPAPAPAPDGGMAPPAVPPKNPETKDSK